MKYMLAAYFGLCVALLLLIFLLSACAASTEELIQEAQACVTNDINAQGIIGQPSDEARKLCWAEVNERYESMERREKRREAEKQCCYKKPVGCKCVDPKELSDWDSMIWRR
jgi:hypothetical protein